MSTSYIKLSSTEVLQLIKRKEMLLNQSAYKYWNSEVEKIKKKKKWVSYFKFGNPVYYTEEEAIEYLKNDNNTPFGSCISTYDKIFRLDSLETYQVIEQLKKIATKHPHSRILVSREDYSHIAP